MNELEHLIAESGIKNKKFVEVLRISHVTWQKKKEELESLSIFEVKQLAEILRISPEKLFKILINEISLKNNNQTKTKD
jgi:hypothetical protein